VAGIDPRNLGPSELARLLNSTPLGEVVSAQAIYRQQNRAGLRVGDGRRIDLIRYVAWLLALRHAPKPEPPADGYDAMKDRARARNAAISASGRDIGALPEVVDPARKARAAKSFRAFCESYFPERFYLAWSADHLTAISRIEAAVLKGGLFALAMPRGSGKTALTEVAVLWAALYGYHEFVALIGATEGHGDELLDSVRTEIETNSHLGEDFPEVCYPVRRLDGIVNRCAGQLCSGERTRIKWKGNTIILPTIEGSKASGVIIRSVALLGRVRGMKHTRPGGRIVRPSLVIPDDPQTDESARSQGPQGQSTKRLKVLAGAVLGMAGPGMKIAGIMPCTVIAKGDMADTILDREKHPEWNGLRTKMVLSFPANVKLWDKYAEVRAEGLRNDDGGAAGTAFYAENREAMDAGAEVSWPARFNDDELSAIQNAMNLKIRDEAAFFAEYQNEPLGEYGDEIVLEADDIVKRLNGRRPGEVPGACNFLTMFADIHNNLLYYVVVAWETNFTGYVMDYGAYPDQGRHYFSLREAKKTLRQLTPGSGPEAAIYAGLKAFLTDYLAREWRRDDGAVMKLDRVLIDAGWKTRIVYQVCRAIGSSAVVPSKGVGVTPSMKPMIAMKRKKGELHGDNWMMPNVAGTRELRHIRYDTNHWKTFVHARLGVAMGDPGGVSLFGSKPERHRLFAEHLTAEYSIRTEGQGRTVNVWKLPPSKPDNHLFDALVGCAVAASTLGVSLGGAAARRQKTNKRRRKKVSYL